MVSWRGLAPAKRNDSRKDDALGGEVNEPAEESLPDSSKLAWSDDDGVRTDTRNDRRGMCCSNSECRDYRLDISQPRGSPSIVNDPRLFGGACHGGRFNYTP